MCLQAVELALSSAASPQRPREPIRRLQSMRQTAAKAGNAVWGVGKFSAKVTAALALCKYSILICHPTTQISMYLALQSAFQHDNRTFLSMAMLHLPTCRWALGSQASA